MVRPPWVNRIITRTVMITFQLGGEELMGRKPVFTAAGTLMMSLALGGCQNSPSPRPAPFVPQSAAATNQNKTSINTAPGGPAIAGNSAPGSLTSQPTTLTSQGTSPLSPTSATSQPGSQLGLA